jgi:5-methylcytosine-specific restriction endonuclease McrA
MTRFIIAIKEKLQGKPLSLRSSKWSSVRKKFLESNNVCAACGCVDHLQVHHKEPFHLHPEKELDPTNFITLCEDGEDHCHLKIGHLGDWKSFNPNVVKDAKKKLRSIKNAKFGTTSSPIRK